jgi:hypothetical protein
MQPRRLEIRDLLNADPTPETSGASHTPTEAPISARQSSALNGVDIRPQLLHLAKFLNTSAALHAPRSVQQNLESVLKYLESCPNTHVQEAIVPVIPDTSESTSPIKRRTHVAINRITTLECLYEYPVGYVLEYPETSSTGAVGHLFRVDPNDWRDPTLNIAYSRGSNRGQTVAGKSVTCALLVDTEGNMVNCAERHTTCNVNLLHIISVIDKLIQVKVPRYVLTAMLKS